MNQCDLYVWCVTISPFSLLAWLPSEEGLALQKCDRESYNHVCLDSVCANFGIKPSDEVYKAACPEHSGLKKCALIPYFCQKVNYLCSYKFRFIFSFFSQLVL